MTVNTINITSGPYPGNGLSDTYEYTFRVNDKTQLSVYETDDAGVQTLLVVDTDYTVNDIGVDEGGTITRLAGNLPTDYIWYIRSNYIENQLTDFSSQGAFFPDIHENQMDHLTFLIQQQLDLINRSFRLDESIDIDGSFTIAQNAAARANKHLSFDSNGDLFLSAGIPSVPVSSFMATVLDDLTASEATTTLKSSYTHDNKAAAVLVEPVNGKIEFIGGTDGGWFKGVTGAAPGTYSDNGGDYCGTQFIRAGGDGSAAWVRVDGGYNVGLPIAPEWFGAVNGADCTTAMQLLLASGYTYFTGAPSSIYFVDEFVSVSNMRFDLNGSTIKLNASQPTYSPVIDIDTVSNVKIYNGTIDGNLSNNLTPTGDPGQDGGMHGIRIYSSSGIILEKITVTNVRTDGIYIGVETIGNTAPSEIKIIDCVSDANYRQGMSVIEVHDLKVIRSRFINTLGTAPESGVDLEPDSALQDITDVSFVNCEMSGNNGNGITSYMRGGTATNWNFHNCMVFGNANDFEVSISATTGTVYEDISFSGSKTKISGKVFVGAASSNTAKHDFSMNDCKIETGTGEQCLTLRDFAADSYIKLNNIYMNGAPSSTSTGLIDVDRILGKFDIHECRLEGTNANSIGLYLLSATNVIVDIKGTHIDCLNRGVFTVTSGAEIYIDNSSVIENGSVYGAGVSDSTIGTKIVLSGTRIKNCGTGLYRTGASSNIQALDPIFESNTTDVGFLNLPSKLSGTGTPEGVVTAPVSSRFYRTDGGAGTSIYIKESGTGNTGWVGK